jgi:hypothetical protein
VLLLLLLLLRCVLCRVLVTFFCASLPVARCCLAGWLVVCAYVRACVCVFACVQCWNDLLALLCLWASARTGQWLYDRAEHASHIPSSKTRAAWHGGFDDAVRTNQLQAAAALSPSDPTQT